MSIDSLRQYAVLDGEQLEQLWRAYDIQTQAANDGCEAARSRFDQMAMLQTENARLREILGRLIDCCDRDDGRDINGIPEQLPSTAALLAEARCLLGSNDLGNRPPREAVEKT